MKEKSIIINCILCLFTCMLCLFICVFLTGCESETFPNTVTDDFIIVGEDDKTYQLFSFDGSYRIGIPKDKIEIPNATLFRYGKNYDFYQVRLSISHLLIDEKVKYVRINDISKVKILSEFDTIQCTVHKIKFVSDYIYTIEF